MPTATTGFAVRCIRCGAESCIRIALDDVQSFSCTECSEDFTADDVRTEIEEWTRVLAWIAQVPYYDGEK